uniref:Cytochrome b n=1 Tax=Paramoeba aparasomata TaxID=2583407 RepID=A0A5P8HC12_9EUKA|nr:cytochrome b [Paramoeba aparasomata]
MKKIKFLPLFSTVYKTSIIYPVSSNITFSWNLGVSSGIMLFSQILTGLFLAMHYIPEADMAFDSVRHIVVDVNNGFIVRSLHANGSSLFFFITYLHLFRGLYYGSYNSPRRYVWLSGVVILLLMIVTAFLGYVLPWGQMSYWAATVITNIIAIIPIIGKDSLMVVWGNYSVSNATLQRFFALHFLLPFIILFVVGVHVIALHENGSSNPVIGVRNFDNLSFHPFFIFKDIFTTMVLLFSFNYYAMTYSPTIIDPDNYIKANPLSTPPHIVPEWYFKMFYAILRSVPNKEFGAFLLLCSILVLFLFPFITKSGLKDSSQRFYHQLYFWLFFSDFWLLTWLGGKPIDEPFVSLGQVCTGYYFIYFLIILPWIAYRERKFLRLS